MNQPPLYKNAHLDTSPFNAHSHKGLHYERFFNQYGANYEVVEQAKLRWIKQHTGSCGTNNALQQSASRQVQLTQHLNGRHQCFSTDWHFVTGLGNAHPVENGFSWHPTLGTPYLPGAAVKGLVRAWLTSWYDIDPNTLTRWFGNEPKAKTQHAGEFIFFDAIPVEPPTLVADVMTPHMGQWYAQGDKIKDVTTDADKLPADWHNPIPIPFLVVRKASLLFSIAPRTNTDASQQALEELMDHLTQALSYLGAGAKTAAGYGRMEIDDNSDIKLNKAIKEQENKNIEAEHQAWLATLTPEQKIIAELTKQLDNDPDKTKIKPGGTFGAKLNKNFKEAAKWPIDSRIALAQLAERFYGQHTSWGNKKKKLERKELIAKLNENTDLKS